MMSPSDQMLWAANAIGVALLVGAPIALKFFAYLDRRKIERLKATALPGE